MSDRAPEALFVGDTSDPWVEAIALAMPKATARLIPGDGHAGTDGTFDDAPVIVVHRPILCARDGEAFRLIKARGPKAPKLILCLGPNVRAREIELWAKPADVILYEATASETIARHVAAWTSPRGDRPEVDVVAGTFETRRVTAESVEAAGYPSRSWRDWDGVPDGGWAVWEVPVLEPRWEATLRDQASRRAVVALIGFADRGLVTQARSHGASACLDFPCEPADLAFVLDRLASRPAIDPPHAVPPPMKAARGMRVWAGPT